MASSGRYSKYPKVNRDIGGSVKNRDRPAEDEARLLEELIVSMTTVGAVIDDTVTSVVDGDTVSDAFDALTVDSTDDVVIDVPELSVPKLLEWVGDDEDRRAAALDVEVAGLQRTTAIRALSGE